MAEGDAIAPVPPVGGIMDDFAAYYRPSREERLRALREGLIVFDTNALLDLYRFGPASRADLLSVMRHVRDRVYVPYQVALEFHWRRTTAVQDRISEFEDQRSSLSKLHEQGKSMVNQLAKRAHVQGERANLLLGKLQELVDDLTRFLDDVQTEYDLDLDELIGSSADPILDELVQLLDGRVGARPSDDQLAADEAEAAQRIDRGIPPGFRDRDKDKNSNGDCLWWLATLRYAAARHAASVTIVSNDIRKGDWVRTLRGMLIGPLPDLHEEMRREAGANLYWATTSDFLSFTPEAIGVDQVSEGTLDEARLAPVGDGNQLEEVVESIRGLVSSSARPLVASAVANAARRVDPSLPHGDWAGSGSFRQFLADYVPEFEFVGDPKPGYVLDPAIHTVGDLPARSSIDAIPQNSLALAEFVERLVKDREVEAELRDAIMRSPVVARQEDAFRKAMIEYLLRRPENEQEDT